MSKNPLTVNERCIHLCRNKIKNFSMPKINEQRPMREDKFEERYVQSISHI